jgi:hypothetical protein
MTFLAKLVVLIFAFTLTFTTTGLNSAWAGGEAGLDDHPEDEGPYYFGFVKDTARKAIRDAKVTAEMKGRPSIVARTNAAGFYRIPGFGKGIAPNNVSLSCSKEGYKQTKAFVKTSAAKKPVTAVEIECTMQPVGAK